MHTAKALWDLQFIGGNGLAGSAVTLASHIYWIVYIATSCSEEDPLCTCVDETLGNFKTACGVRPVASERALQLVPVIPAKARLCLRFGCRQSSCLKSKA